LFTGQNINLFPRHPSKSPTEVEDFCQFQVVNNVRTAVYFLFGKNFLNGKSNPARLKTIIIISGGNNEDCDSEGRLEARPIQARK
jgi:hypothetical protein